MKTIDFVIPWVDGNDTMWRRDFSFYLSQSESIDDTRSIRYRNWDNLRYWFQIGRAHV